MSYLVAKLPNNYIFWDENEGLSKEKCSQQGE